MTALNPTIVKAIKANGLLKEGRFAYRSGQHGHWLIDRDQLLTEPEFASHLGYAIAKRFFTDKTRPSPPHRSGARASHSGSPTFWNHAPGSLMPLRPTAS